MASAGFGVGLQNMEVFYLETCDCQALLVRLPTDLQYSEVALEETVSPKIPICRLDSVLNWSCLQGRRVVSFSSFCP